MSEQKEITELSHALISNFKLKAISLSVLFAAVFLFQASLLIYFGTQTDLIGTIIPKQMVIIGPMVICTAILCEILTVRYLKRILKSGEELKKAFIYLVTFIEVSFPMGVMVMIGSAVTKNNMVTPLQITNSPIFVVVFIMIVLSSLMLDFRLCIFAGVVAGLEYLLVSLNFINETNVQRIEYVNVGGKSVLVFATGLLAGFVSKRIREAVISSLHAKNELIHNLDLRVAEKTAEVVAQKDEIENKNVLLEEKQKEILDSIHYAKRIQRTLLPSEKYIARHVNGFKKR